MSAIKQLLEDKLEFDAEMELEGEINPWDDPEVIAEMHRLADENHRALQTLPQPFRSHSLGYQRGFFVMYFLTLQL